MKYSFYFLGMFNIFPITIRNIFINKFNNLINIINASTKCVEGFVNNCNNLLSYYHTVLLDSVAQQAPQESPLVQVQKRASMFSMIKRFITQTKQKMKNIFYFLGMFNIFPLLCGVLSVSLKIQVNICDLIGNIFPVARKEISPRIQFYLSNSAKQTGMSPSRAGKINSLNNKTTTMKNSLFSFPFPVIFGLLFQWATTSYFGSFIRLPGLQSRAYSFPKVCMWEIDPATRDCRPICKIGWDIVLIKTC